MDDYFTSNLHRKNTKTLSILQQAYKLISKGKFGRL